MPGNRLRAFWSMALVLVACAAAACAPKRMAPVTFPPAAPATRTVDPGSEPAGAFTEAELDSLGLVPDDDGYGAGDPGAADQALFYGPLDEAAATGARSGPPAPGDAMPGDAALVPAEAGTGDRVAALAKTQVGKPYGWGATGPERFDCSGLAMYVYRQLGIALPRVSLEQASTGVHIERNDLKPGDLVFFSLRRAFDHVGIFLGNNRFVHAPRRHEPVRVDNLDDAWWNRAYRGARRVLGGQP